MKKVCIEMIVDDTVNEKDIDNLIQNGSDYTMVEIVDWDVKISVIEKTKGEM